MRSAWYIVIPSILTGAVLVSLFLGPFLFNVLLADIEKPEEPANCGEVFLSWEETERAQRHQLYRNGDVIYEGDGFRYRDREVLLNETRDYHLVALNKSGESEPSEITEVQIERPCPPEPPENITVHEQECGGSVSIEWSEPSRAERYRVSRAPIPFITGKLHEISQTEVIYEGPENQFSEEGLIPGGFYSYRVEAGNESGWSEVSSKFVRASLPCLPERPEPPVAE
ncbi:MAG: fibronectin type III domain-containing protein [Candidatus Paceibacterota bacterium]